MTLGHTDTGRHGQTTARGTVTSGRRATQQAIIGAALIMVVVSLGCGEGSDPGPAPFPDAPVPTVDARPAATIPIPDAASISPVTLSPQEVRGLADPGVKGAFDDLVRRTGQELGPISVMRAERATWADASLGCPEPGVSYVQALTDGIRLVLGHGGTEYDYRIGGPRARLCLLDEGADPMDRRPLEGMWSRLAPVPTARSEVAAAELNGKLYVFGGFGPGAIANEEYDPATDTWRARAPIPGPVNHAAAVALGDRIYLIGGFDDRFGPVDTVLAYDPAADAWESLPDLPAPRGALAAAAVDGLIYAIGGQGPSGDVGTTEVYDPVGRTWRSLAGMPTPRDHLASSEVSGKIYVIGGRLGSFTRNVGNGERYDPGTDGWTAFSPLPTVRSGIGASAVDGRIYVFGGESGDGTFDDNERYDPETDTWTKMPSLPTARHELASVAVGNRIYVLAGGPTPGGSASGANEVFIIMGDGPRQ